MSEKIDNLINNVLANKGIYTSEQLSYYGILSTDVDDNTICNEYDPVVWHDPLDPPFIIVFPRESSADDKNIANHNIEEDTEMVAGKLYPILEVAGNIITDPDMICFMRLYYTDFTPSISVGIYETKQEETSHVNMEKVGFNDTIKLIIEPEENTGYRPIKLQFNITDQYKDTSGYYNGDVWKFNGTYKCSYFTDNNYEENIDYYTCESCDIKGLELNESTPDYASNYENMIGFGSNGAVIPNIVANANTEDKEAKNKKISELVDNCFNTYKQNRNKTEILEILKQADLDYSDDATDNETDRFVELLVSKYPDGVNDNTKITNKICEVVTAYEQYKQQKNDEELADAHKTNTWKALHSIAEQAHLGFAGNESVKKINDTQQRRINNQHFEDYIKEKILPYAGNGETNIIDAWVDLYGYLVVVNKGEIFNISNLDFSTLKINASIGINQRGDSKNGIKTHLQRVDRVLTNFNELGVVSNLEISEFSIISDFTDVNNTGNIKRIVVFHSKDNKGTGSCTQYDLDASSNLNDQTISFNDSANSRKVISETKQIMSPTNKYNYNYEAQYAINNMFNAKLKKKRAKCVLARPNYGLQRGTLIGISLWTDSKVPKEQIRENINQIAKDSNINIDEYTDMLSAITTNQGAQMPDITNSGLYYIDGMEFYYDINTKKIRQTLYLIMKSPQINIFSSVENSHNKIYQENLENAIKTEDVASTSNSSEKYSIDSETSTSAMIKEAGLKI